jgi:hypothetical protein
MSAKLYKKRDDFLWGLWVECMDYQNANPHKIKDADYQAYKMRIAHAYNTHTQLMNREFKKQIDGFLGFISELVKYN